MIISDIITEILEEVGGDTSDSTLVTKMLGFFKSGLREIPAYVRDRNFYFESTYTLPSASNTLDLSNFSGFIREREVWFQGDNLIHIPIYVPPSLQYFEKIVTPNSPGKPFYRIIKGRTMQFDKKVDAGIVIGMDYLKEVSGIAASDTWYPDEQILQAAKYFCKKVYWQYQEDLQKALDCERQGKEIASKLEEEYEVQEMGNYVDERY